MSWKWDIDWSWNGVWNNLQYPKGEQIIEYSISQTKHRTIYSYDDEFEIKLHVLLKMSCKYDVVWWWNWVWNNLRDPNCEQIIEYSILQMRYHMLYSYDDRLESRLQIILKLNSEWEYSLYPSKNLYIITYI